MIPLFAGQVEKGELKLENPTSFNMYKRSFEGKKVQLSIQKYKTLKTTQQLRYLWGVVYKIISDEIGIDKDSVHIDSKIRFFSEKQWIELKSGREEILIIKSIAQATTTEISIFIENIKRFYAIEMSIVIPDADKIDIIS